MNKILSLMRFNVVWLTKNKESKNEIFLIWDFEKIED